MENPISSFSYLTANDCERLQRAGWMKDTPITTIMTQYCFVDIVDEYETPLRVLRAIDYLIAKNRSISNVPLLRTPKVKPIRFMEESPTGIEEFPHVTKEVQSCEYNLSMTHTEKQSDARIKGTMHSLYKRFQEWITPEKSLSVPMKRKERRQSVRCCAQRRRRSKRLKASHTSPYFSHKQMSERFR